MLSFQLIYIVSMKYFTAVVAILLITTFNVFAQQNITLTGKLLDEADSQPIIAGSVELLNERDSTVITRTITNIDGVFSLKNLSKGKYVLRATFIGYLPVTRPITLTENQPSVNLGSIAMQMSDVLLKEALVEGKRPEIVVKNDTIEYDAASYKVPENSNIEELIKKLPGAEVDKDGKITVNGKEVKRFLVDGKEFFSDDPQVASRNLPAEMVDKLQVHDQRSEMAQMTGFDDGEEETVINITVRPGMKQGTIGNALVGAGADMKNDNDLRYQLGAFLNHMNNNDRYTLMLGRNNNNNMGAADLGANQFGGMRMRRGSGGITETTNVMLSINKELSSTATLNADFRYNGQDRHSDVKKEQTSLSSFRQQLERSTSLTNYDSNNFAANFRFEWKPDTLNTLIFRPNISYNNSSSDEAESSDIYDYNTLNPVSNSKSFANNEGQGLNFRGRLDYSHRFSKYGRVLSLNLEGRYNQNRSWENNYNYLKKYIEDPDVLFNEEWLNQRLENKSNTNNIRATLSWVEPLGKNFFLQALYRIGFYDTKGLNSTYNIYEDVNDILFDPWWYDSRTKYGEIDPSKSRSTDRESLEQRFGLNVKMTRSKYNLTLGFNIDPTNSTNYTYQPFDGSVPVQQLVYPFDSRLTNQRGDSIISEIEQDVVNFSPIINFNYRFGERSNLRIDYEGYTEQPSANQLRDYIDTSRPTEWTQGNPNLKPSYSNRVRAHFSKYVQSSQLMYNFFFNGNYAVNDIVAVTTYLEDGVIRLNSYENVDGNWNGNLRGMFNIPLKNKKFTVGSMAMFGLTNQNSFVSDRETHPEPVKNNSKAFNTMERAFINYRSDLFDVGLSLFVSYSDITYTETPDNNLRTTDYGIGANTTWYLPYNITIESDINYTKRSGYVQGFNTPEAIWNAAVTKQLFNKKFGIGSLKLQIYNILQDRNNIIASNTINGYSITDALTIPSYFMCSFIFKFSAFPKSSSATEEDLRGGGRRWGGPGGGPPPGHPRF